MDLVTMLDQPAEASKKLDIPDLEKERYQALCTLISDFACLIHVQPDGQLKYGWIAPSCHKITGFTEKELSHHDDIVQLIHPDDVADVRSKLNDIIDVGEKASLQYRIISKNGKIRHLSTEFLPVVDEYSGTRVYVASQDITAQLLDRKTRRKLAQEEARVNMLSDFITLVSHEFFTPLTTMKTSLYLLGKSGPTEMQANHLDRIGNQAENIIELVNSLRTIVELDKEGSELTIRLIQIDEMINGIVRGLQTLVDEHELEVHVEIDKDTPIYGDGNQLRMAIHNLVKNAAQYAKPNGKVIIRTYHDEYENVIEVEDDGVGICEKDRPHIFERFYRADTARVISGSGLGLSIAQAIADHHQGRMDFETSEGEGSIFRILLPRNV